MDASRQQLHDLIDIVDSKELNVLYAVLTKFIPEDVATPDEIKAILEGRADFERGETISHQDIEWD